MKYIVQILFDDLKLNLFEIDIPSSEVQNLIDAFTCERIYNNFDMEI